MPSTQVLLPLQLQLHLHLQTLLNLLWVSVITTRECRTPVKLLLQEVVYLGEPHVANNVTWACVGKAYWHVTDETATEYKSSSDLSAVDLESFTLTNPDAPILSAVVLISEEDYWLTVDANWKGPSTVAPKLSDAKASCTGQAPDNEVFIPDFLTVLNNIKDIIAKGQTKGFKVL